MSTSTPAALRIQQLKTELEREESALAATQTLASELREKTLIVNESTRLANMNSGRLAEAQIDAGRARYTRDRTPHQFASKREELEVGTRRAEEKVLRLRAEGEELCRKLATDRAALKEIQQKIASHPDYLSVRRRQRELAAEAAKVAVSVFETPLNRLHRVVELAKSIENQENDLIIASLPTLSRAGLPEITRTLNSFFSQVIPMGVIQGLLSLEAGVRTETLRLKEYAERGIVQ
jgi:hypothetical protein